MGTNISAPVLYHGIDASLWTPRPSQDYVLWNKTRIDSVCDPRQMMQLAEMASDVRFVPGQTFLGGRSVNDTVSHGWITGVDAVNGQVRWRYRSSRPVVGAVTATAGGLILAGELTGDFVALDAASGAVRYRFNTGGPIGAGIITYEAAGQQYIAVASGRPSRFWIQEHSGSPVVMVFTVDRTQPAR